MPQTESQQYTQQQIVVFKLGHEEYGLSINQIKEVVLTPAITRMPQSPSFVRGVANIRGTVIAMLDLEAKFGLETSSSAECISNYTLIIDSSEYKIGILVKEVPNTLSISTDAIEDAFDSGKESHDSFITGIVKLDRRLIILIDIFKVINEKDTYTSLK